MSKTTMLNQPFSGQLGYYLIDALENDVYEDFTFAVAFAKNSGVLRLKDSMERFRKNGATIAAFVGIDLGGTSYEALTSLLGLVDELFVIHVESDQTFHPKIYSLRNETEGLLIVGSHNLTGGGLWTNFESCTITSLSFENPIDETAQKQAEEYFATLANIGESFSMLVSSQEDIDKLLDAKYIEKEVVTHIKRAKKQKDTTGTDVSSTIHYFGGSFKAPLPKLPQTQKTHTAIIEVSENPVSKNKPHTSITSLDQDVYDVVWFETRAMTGGSANQLDISMKAVVEAGDPSGTEFDLGEFGVMKGGVQFFGVDPQHPEQQKDIVINYNGVDYEGNTLLYYTDGERPNGSWRLQIKGIADDGRSFTSSIERGYLKHKLLTFQKVESDYFFMTVFPEDDLEEFKEASTVVARNGLGASSRFFGLL